MWVRGGLLGLSVVCFCTRVEALDGASLRKLQMDTTEAAPTTLAVTTSTLAPPVTLRAVEDQEKMCFRVYFNDYRRSDNKNKASGEIAKKIIGCLKSVKGALKKLEQEERFQDVTSQQCLQEVRAKLEHNVIAVAERGNGFESYRRRDCFRQDFLNLPCCVPTTEADDPTCPPPSAAPKGSCGR